MRKALEDQDFENIKSYLLEGNEAALPAHQKLMLDRRQSSLTRIP